MKKADWTDLRALKPNEDFPWRLGTPELKRVGVIECPYCGRKIDIAVYKDRELPNHYVLLTRQRANEKEKGPVKNHDFGREFLESRAFPYKEVHLSCGHSFRCEFSQYRKGQKTYCPECKKQVRVVKVIDTVTGKELEY